MTNKVFYFDHLGDSFVHNAGGKTEVKLDNSGNVQFSISPTGLKGEVEIPAIPVDVKFDSATFNADGDLEVTLSDGSKKTVDFTPEVVVKAIESADNAQKGRIVTALKNNILEAIRGEEIQDFNGVTKGHLLPVA